MLFFASEFLALSLLLKMWSWQESLPDPLGSYIEFSVMFLLTFYVLALLPIKHCVGRLEVILRKQTWKWSRDMRRQEFSYGNE